MKQQRLVLLVKCQQDLGAMPLPFKSVLAQHQGHQRLFLDDNPLCVGIYNNMCTSKLEG